MDPLVLWTFTGVTTGMMISLAGSGGGIIAIPLLMFLGNMSLKMSSGYALIAVAVAALFSWAAQYRNTQYRIAMVIILTSSVTSYIMAQYKQDLPHWFDMGLLWVVCGWGLYKIWAVRSDNLLARAPKEKIEFHDYLLAALCGMLLGPLVTIIGAGGGLLTVTWLLVVNKLSMKEAVATDVFSILLVAPFSAWAQGRFDLAPAEFMALGGGIVIAVSVFFVIKFFVPERWMIHLRRVSLSMALVAAVVASFVKSPYWHAWVDPHPVQRPQIILPYGKKIEDSFVKA